VNVTVKLVDVLLSVTVEVLVENVVMGIVTVVDVREVEVVVKTTV
jgi:hypothetical protein